MVLEAEQQESSEVKRKDDLPLRKLTAVQNGAPAVQKKTERRETRAVSTGNVSECSMIHMSEEDMAYL